MSRRTVLYLAAWNVQAVHEGIVDYAHEGGWILDNSMCYTGAIPDGVVPDGVICRHAYRADIIDFARSLDVPTVAFEHDDRLPVPRVYYDEEEIGAMAARHLIDRDFKVLCFLHLGFTPYQMPRMDGFRREAEAAGCRFVALSPPQPPKSWHPAPGEAWTWLEQAMGTFDEPIGMMVTNDQIARPTIDALAHMGYRVPTQVAVVSAENDAMICEIAAVSISSVEAATRRIGYEAARMLDRMMDGEAPDRETLRVPPTHVEVRESSDIRAIDNIHAAEALRYIWRHYREPMRVEHVAEEASITRRHLQTLFDKHVGHTMQEEIARVRTARACHLLKTSALKVNAIAAQSGFNTSLHLHRTLQTIVGMGPKAFRDSGEMPELGCVPASVGLRSPRSR
ncbi:MAG: substrate-binding domain-containing protein [Kiritimatiellae bacterium]|nr:substrate-binding domain-containing protein [Kiritimatiellia bacterium]